MGARVAAFRAGTHGYTFEQTLDTLLAEIGKRGDLKPWQIQHAADAARIYRHQYRAASDDGQGGRPPGGPKDDALILVRLRQVIRLPHGPVDALRIADPGSGTGEAPAQECPECHEVITAGYATCPQCGHEFPPRQRTRHEAQASDAGIVSDQSTRAEHEVSDVCYAVHTKRGAPPAAPHTMRVDYRVSFNVYVSEWVCLEHEGYPRHKAEQWWRARSNEPVPDSAEAAVELAGPGALAPPLAIRVEHKAGEKYDRIVAYRLGAKPPRLESSEDLPEYAPPIDESEVPF